MKKRILALLLAGVLVFGLAACGEKEEAKEETMAEETKEEAAEETAEETKEEAKEEEVKEEEVMEEAFSVALVTDTGGIDDKSFNQGTWEGIVRFSEDTGAESVFAQSNSDADYIPNLSTFAEDEHSLIVAPGFLFGDAITEVAANFPDQKFLIIDMVAGGGNVANAVFAEEQGSFLVGVAAGKAAMDAGKDTVGFIGGMDFDLIQKFEAGFEAGVTSVSADITVLVDYVGDFVDAGKGQSIASKMYDEGAYVIYHAAGGAGNGLIKEARDRRTNEEDVWAIGVDKDQYEDGIYDGTNSAILTSMMKRVDVAAYTVAEMAMKGEFPGGEILAFTLSNGGVSIPETNPNLSDEIIALVADFEAKIIAEEINVPVLPLRLQ
jgi:basic membrane protein A